MEASLLPFSASIMAWGSQSLMSSLSEKSVFTFESGDWYGS